MKSFSFRNSSRTLRALLAAPAPPRPEATDSFYDEDLQFSTFRSDDYCYYDCLPHELARSPHADQSEDDSLGELRDTESEGEGEEKKLGSSEGSTNESLCARRPLSFRNRRAAIRAVLGEECLGAAGRARRGLNFRNSS